MMLVLTRKAGDGDQAALRLGEDIEVRVLEVRGDQVRLGISAPPDIPIHRAELLAQAEAHGDGLSAQAEAHGDGLSAQSGQSGVNGSAAEGGEAASAPATAPAL